MKSVLVQLLKFQNVFLNFKLRFLVWLGLKMGTALGFLLSTVFAIALRSIWLTWGSDMTMGTAYGPHFFLLLCKKTEFKMHLEKFFWIFIISMYFWVWNKGTCTIYYFCSNFPSCKGLFYPVRLSFLKFVSQKTHNLIEKWN